MEEEGGGGDGGGEVVAIEGEGGAAGGACATPSRIRPTAPAAGSSLTITSPPLLVRMPASVKCEQV
jgi:hypothetical protein